MVRKEKMKHQIQSGKLLCRTKPYGKYVECTHTRMNHELFEYAIDDGEPEVQERWWYCNFYNRLHNKPLQCASCVEVPPADLQYVSNQIERHQKGEIDLSEWEYRKLVRGEQAQWINPDGGTYNGIVGEYAAMFLRFVLKSAPEKKSGWEEFEVAHAKDGMFRISGLDSPTRAMTLSEAWHYAIDRGMCPQFWFEGSGVWHNSPTLIINGKTAKLLKMRVWE